MSWLITGGCGFIGINLIHRLLEGQEASRIRVLDNLSVGSREDLARVCKFEEAGEGSIASSSRSSDSVELLVGDILDPEVVGSACEGVSVVVHLAANTGVLPSIEDPQTDCRTNVMGTLNCLQAAREAGVKRFVFASSGAPLGQQEPPICEEMVPRPLSPYGASKLAGEGYCSAFFGSFGLETVVLRFGNVYGPRSSHKSSVVAKFIKLLMAGEPLPIYGDGRQTRDFIYVEDLVEAIRLGAVVSDIGGEVFQIATHREHTVLEVAEVLNRLARKHLGWSGELIHEEEKEGEIRRNFSDISKAREVLGFEPMNGLEDGLERTFLWFLSKGSDKAGL